MEEIAIKTSSKDIYTPISYKENIIAWLEECKKVAVNKPIIRETLTQYIHLIKKLTNTNINSEMDRELLELFIKDKEDFIAFKNIKNLDIYKIHKIILEKLKPTLELIAKDNSITLSYDEIEKQWTEDMKDHKHDIYPRFYFHSPNLNGDRIRICFEFYVEKKSTIASRFCFGFFYHPPSSERPNDRLNNKKLKEEFENVFVGGWSHPYWLCAKDYDGYEDWGNLDTLEKIIFGDFKKGIKSKIETIGDFKEDIKSKIETMLKMLKEHSVVHKD